MQRFLHKRSTAYLLLNLLIILVFFFLNYSAFGQATRLDLNVTRVYAENDHEGWPNGDNDYVWNIWFNGASNATCIKESGSPGWHDTYHTLANDLYFANINLSSDILLRTEAWEDDDCGGGCSFNSCWDNDDDGHCGPNNTSFDFANYAPVVINTTTLWPCTTGNPYAVRYEFSYTVPTPQKPSVSAPSGLICNGTITLSTNSYLKAGFLSGTDFLWYYQVNNTWRYLGISDANSNNGNFSISVDQFRLRTGISGINVNTVVNFKVVSRYTSGNGTSGTSAESPESNTIQISPATPTLSDIQVTPSCPNTPTGTILATVNGLFASSGYLYALKPLGNTAPCNPETGNPACGNVIASGRSFWNYVYIQGIPAGSYNLVVMNPAGTSGLCGTYIPITVGAEPVLQVSTPAITHVSCQGGSDGAVTLTSSGGVPTITYELSKAGFLLTNNTGLFSSLTAGSYNAKIKDACNQEINRTVVVQEPTRVNAIVSSTYPSCNAPADGIIQGNITGGNVDYMIKLLRGTEVLQDFNHKSATFSFQNLASGEYTLEIKDALRMQCDGFSQTITLVAPATLLIAQANVAKTNVSCFGRTDGNVQLNNVNVSGAFLYILTNQSTGSSTTLNTTSQFTGLPAGNYSLAMKRNISGCNDRFDYPQTIVITQPERIEISLQRQNIRCNGETNGKITAVINGATPTDQYLWEIKLNNSWATLNNTGSSLNNLSAGTYRMRLTNASGCVATSNEVTIVEPQVLSISNVLVKDMVCFGEKGEIEVILQGGVPPYSYEYTSSSTTVNSTSSKTSLDKGIYTLVVKDFNGCTVNYQQPLTITAPDSPFAFSYTLSNFNGYNISCTGASNGYADIVATGGNGAGYTGYQYSLDGQAYGQSARIENLSAGNHTISARDGRGCIISKPIVITAPAAQIKLELASKQDVKCSGDYNGSLSFTTTGGVEPYVYTLNEKISQAGGQFSLLEPGNYNVSVKDKNGCSAEYQTSINLLNPPMSILVQKSEVSCFGGADGTIKAEVTGGSPPFSYSWDKNAGTTSDIKNLSAGDYKLKVSDQQGCSQERIINLSQPAELTVKAQTVPVCVGKTNGSIRLQAAGGTASYQYSIDGGVNFQANPQFTVGAGKYDVRVKDGNHCEISSSAEVITRNDQPEPNFIVATTQDALDTLVIKEISVPKPDSVEWVFDPAITVVKHDAWSPIITVKDSGTYVIGMKGFFGGCDYTNNLTLTINPFNPAEKKASKIIPIKAIQSLAVMPNPNEGEFEVSVELNAKQRLSLVVFDVLGVIQHKEYRDKTTGFKTKVNVQKTGIYIIQAVTDTDAQELRVIVNK